MRAETLARELGVSNSRLREYNPALLPPVWSGTKYVPAGFKLRLPADIQASAPERVLASVAASERFDQQTPDLFHKIIRGDTLSTIAARYRTSVTELMALNGLNNHRIRAGKTLRLPWTGDGLPPLSEGTERYVVRRGDTLGVIARRAKMGESELMALNNISNRNRIYPGQELMLRGSRPAVAQTVVSAKEATPAPTSATVDVAIQAEVLEAPDGLPVADNTQAGPAPAESVSLADPNDYVVASDGTIQVQAAETLGHYADWLGIKTQKLRNLNGYSFRQPLVIGNRLKLDFSAVPQTDFSARRIDFHRAMQEAFFTRYRIADRSEHRLRRGENLWYLAQRKFRVPVWLLRQYNPEMDFDRLQPGARIVYPVIETVGKTKARRSSLAEAG
jgi:membrane-bound lytic murein transglycosylase D